MKSTQFNRNPTAIRVRQEKTRKARPVTKWVYFTLLLLIIGYALYRLVLWQFLLTTTGQVFFQKTDVQVLREGRLTEIHVYEGKDVKENDELFTVVYPEEAGLLYRDVSWVVRERWQLEQKVNAKALELRLLEQRLMDSRRRLGEDDEDILLEIKNPDLIRKLRREIADHEQGLHMLREELDQLRKQKNKLEKMPDRVALPRRETRKVFRAPSEGTVTRIFKATSEVVMPSETVLKLHHSNAITIRAFYDQKDSDYVKEGENVTIKLPNSKIKLQGFIKRRYLSTFPLPVELQPRFEPTRRKIVVDIELVNFKKEDFFYKMKVSVQKIKIPRFMK